RLDTGRRLLLWCGQRTRPVDRARHRDRARRPGHPGVMAGSRHEGADMATGPIDGSRRRDRLADPPSARAVNTSGLECVLLLAKCQDPGGAAVVKRWFTHLPGAIVLTAFALSAAAYPTSAAAGFGSISGRGPAAVHESGNPASLAPGTITTIGGGVGGPGPATTVAIGDPCALTYSGGTLYAGDQGGVLASGAVRAISVKTGLLTTPVGSSGLSGFTRDGGPAAGKVGWPCGVAVDRWRH